MAAFNEVIADLQLFDVPLQNRRFTWSNKQPSPIFSRLDRCLLSLFWLQEFPCITLQALPTIVSDHCPLLLKCTGFPTQKKSNKIEKYWFSHKDFASISSTIWNPTQQSLDPIHDFTSKLAAFHSELGRWNKEVFKRPNLTLQNAKTLIVLLDAVEERRPLAPLEFLLRIKLREKAFEIANVLELRWHQRARSRWLSSGDQNTRYFHAIASAKRKNKSVSTLIVDGRATENPAQIEQAFSSFYKNLFGTVVNVSPCNLATLYEPNTDLAVLDVPFTECEVHHAVMRLSNNKASGPDGMPNEIFKLYWPHFKHSIMQIFDKLSNDVPLDLEKLNFAHIILIPKFEGAQTVTDFRPISIINLIPKLISKVLALRMQPLLPDLISQSQTGFIKGRLISENFIVARELVNHLNSSSNQAFLFKLDFYKAFDSVDWNFLFSVLLHRGFPSRYVAWIKLLLTTATSAVLLNGVLGETFKHNRGLRQGDPLSPFLFILVADVLAIMLQAAATPLHSTISSKLPFPFFLLQYADDTLLFVTGDARSLSILSLTLTLFQQASGLTVNHHKSSFVPFNATPETLLLVSQLFGFVREELPLTYLGLPLTVGRPDRLCFQPILDRIEAKLTGWTGKLLSRAGRLTLISSVLSAIPSYFMSVFLLPSWLIQHIDRIRKRFLWGYADSGTRKMHLLAWSRVCLPKKVGGLGVTDLSLQNRALLTRWVWKLFKDRHSLWFKLASCLYSPAIGCQSPHLWIKEGSFFWKDLNSVKYIFQVSTKSLVGTGTGISFWFDSWGGQPLVPLVKGFDKPLRPRISLKDALHILPQLLPMPRSFHLSNLAAAAPSLPLLNNSDSIAWKWTACGNFSVSSLYNFLSTAGKVFSPCSFLWKFKVPPSLKLFIFLLVSNKLLTQQQLSRRGIQVQPGCVLCRESCLEDSLHLFFTCPFTLELWNKLQRTFHLPALSASYSIQYSATNLLRQVAINDVLTSAVCTTFWSLWLERNNRIFRNTGRHSDVLLLWIRTESNAYRRFC
ncbi:hypothetical protein LUZ61_019609 [Rhynchospora tenuis]|uniref:Reverse transcriptase domain-containing protein n=1 Tax=Rhynchospora tenuis TaxID=198213 RepID=A0AAD5ZBG5_9POAL|nr:hypothetical protein LUZ61_019609 [Rhynchospora tenuis]